MTEQTKFIAPVGKRRDSWQKAVIGGVPLKRKPILLVIVDILLGPSKAVTNTI